MSFTITKLAIIPITTFTYVRSLALSIFSLIRSADCVASYWELLIFDYKYHHRRQQQSATWTGAGSLESL